MKTDAAPLIRLKNYQASPYTISTVDMRVNLHPTKTLVEASLKVERCSGTAKNAPLILDGDELELVSFSVDGEALNNGFEVSPQQLTLHSVPQQDKFGLTIVTQLSPSKNTKLMGLYQSSGVFCTQCEAEGFRRITYFLDRPDVLAIYTVRLEADKSSCPVLLANGNLIETGDLSSDRHFAVWHDPHPKPSYLFAMVGGALDVLSDTFTTHNGNSVDLNIYVEPGKANLATYAMDALIRSMKWDEEVYGREYDLDVFNIVAVSDFNMGAMENKGLNVFNDKYVLADADIATDNDYANIEAIIAHEYFHNWTGNRITCRDWFQLCLKEGLTVFRDQEFSADQRSRAVQRILQVRGLKASQFPEDAGPLAHPVRPAAYKEINNFYTATVYQKGAELVRMIHTLIGPQAYRAGTDLYFERHDGEAAVVEDFLKCFEDSSGYDLTQFALWYSQAGTPVVEVEEKWEEAGGRYTLKFTQSTPPTPGQDDKAAVPIPVRFGLIGKNGDDMIVETSSRDVHEDLIVLTKNETSVTFDKLPAKPVPSLLRGFSAPVRLKYAESLQARLFRARYDSDLYNRWEAMDGYAMHLLVAATHDIEELSSSDAQEFIETLVASTHDEKLEPLFRGNALTLPNVMAISREIGANVDPIAVLSARKALTAKIGHALGDAGLALAASLDTDSNADMLTASGERSLKYALLPLLMAGNVKGSTNFTEHQFSTAETMNDRIKSLEGLVHHSNAPSRADAALETFYKTYEDNDLVINNWFSVQAVITEELAASRVSSLISHPRYSLTNPNRLRALLGPFAAHNPTALYANGGAGLKMFIDEMIKLDDINPQVAARLLTLLGSYKIYAMKLQDITRRELHRIAQKSRISPDVQEIVENLLK